MLYLSSSTLLYWVFVLALIALIQRILARLHDVSRAQKLGCLPPPSIPHRFWDPLDLASLRKVFRAAKAQRLPDHFVQREDEMSKLYGFRTTTLRTTDIGTRNLFTSDPKNIQALLATQFHDFELGSNRNNNFAPLLGRGIFSSDGKQWEHSRAMLRPSFARERVSALDLEHRHCRNLLLALPAQDDGWTAGVNLQPLFFRLTLDSSTEFLFGESVNSQLAELVGNSGAIAETRSASREAAFTNAFDKAQDHLASRIRLGSKYWLHNPANFTETCKQCHDFIDYYVQIALQKEVRSNEAEKEANKGKNEYVFLEELAQQSRDPVEIRSQLLSILLAGRDTTASLLGWVFYFLARHQDVFFKLREHILTDFGEYREEHDITFAGLKSSQYLQYCLSEVLRLLPIVPLNGRTCAKDTTLPRGGGPDGLSPIFVKKGTVVGYSVYVMQRNKDIWGKDADEFRPDRWVGRKAGWEFLPFNGGPRVCLGQQFALTSAGFAVARLLQRFDRMENLDPTSDFKQALTLTSVSGTGVQVRLHEARA